MGYHRLFPKWTNAEGEARVRFSWHSLNENERGILVGPAFTSGRGYFAVDRKRFSVEWHLKPWPHSIGVAFGLDGHGDNEIDGSIRLPFLQLYWGYEGGLNHLPEREVGVRWNDGYLWWSFWHSRHHWSSKTSRWRHGAFNPIDFLLGKQEYSTITIETVETAIPLPEGPHPATIKLEVATWKRPRWPWPQMIQRADVEMHKPAVIPGKGENSWDQDDDAIYSSTFPAKSVGEAIGHVVGSVMQTRLQRGGRHWAPKDGEA